MNQASKSKSAPSTSERWLSAALLGVLVLIGVAVLMVQGHYDAGKWREQALETPQPSAAKPASVGIEGLQPFSDEEQYDAVTLSDKINGKAELYLAAGFKQLKSQRFALSTDTSRWMERYVYLMAGFRNAYAVYSTQRRSDIEYFTWHDNAYAASNGVFMVHGPYYVEIIASEASEEMRARVVDVAQAFIATHEATSPPLVELSMFPKELQAANSLALNASSTFGLQGFDWVYTCRYADSAHEAIGFVTRRASPEEAEEWVQRFMAQWRDYGGEDVSIPTDDAGLQGVTILDVFELAWQQGPYVVGVHEATSLEFGLSLASRLKASVEKGTHEQ